MNNKKLIRSNFREAVFKRDGYKCKACGKSSEKLDAHHITDRNDILNGGYVKENGVSLCSHCHILAEKFHISGGEEYMNGFHPNDLYKLIGSSKELAIEKSKNLK